MYLYDKLSDFFQYIQNQFEYGGRKYAFSGEKESTDCLYDDFSPACLYGTLSKYCRRYSNLARSRDLFKIACYSFILFLKRGYHLDPQGVDVPINTTVDIKSKYFSKFKESTTIYLEDMPIDKDVSLDEVYHLLANLIDIKHNFKTGEVTITTDWKKLTDNVLFEIFGIAYVVWRRDFGDQEEQDEDVYNETGGKNITNDNTKT